MGTELRPLRSMGNCLRGLTPPEKATSTGVLSCLRWPLLALRCPLMSGITWMWTFCVLPALVPCVSPASTSATRWAATASRCSPVLFIKV